MRNFLLSVFLGCLSLQYASAQELLQTVRGKISDRVTGLPLSGTNIRMTSPTNDFSATSTEEGLFKLSVPVGRYRVSASFTGYKPFKDELLVIAGRESVVNISLQATETLLEVVEIASSTAAPEIPGLQSLSIEKTLRVPANFFDPVRVISAYPGVVTSNDQANGIIVRGNSPNGLLWRLNGLDIVNPNHLANAGTLSDRPAANGGGVNIMSSQLLDRTDFYTGYIPSSYGNVMAGVVDMKMRDGNREKREYTAQASLIGLDVSAEGPINNKGTSTFLANYRYSTVGLLSAMGVNFGGEAITFQDFSFNAAIDGSHGKKLSVFGLWGTSKNDFENTDSTTWEEDKDRYKINFQARTYGAGLNYVVPSGKGSFVFGASYSSSRQERLSQDSKLNRPFVRLVLFDDYDGVSSVLSSNIRYEWRSDKKLFLDAGVMTNYLANDLEIMRMTGCRGCITYDLETLSGNTDGVLVQPFANVRKEFSGKTEVSAGVRYVHYTYNSSASVEPRVALTLKPGSNSGIIAAYSLISQLQQPSIYIASGNNDLGFTKSHHLDLSYWQHLTQGLKLKAGVYYQTLFDVPVEQDITSTFSAINVMDEFVPGNLVNEGTGQNYGVDATLEKYFFTSTYLLLGGSYYESKYEGGDGVSRDTRFNGNYTFSGVYGKEWTKATRNRTIGLNTRILYLGGLRESSINMIESQRTGQTVYDMSDPFNNKLRDYFRVDLRVSWRKNKPGYTRTLAIDIQNLTSQQNEAYHYFDQFKRQVITKYQLGIIPVIVYRIDF